MKEEEYCYRCGLAIQEDEVNWDGYCEDCREEMDEEDWDEIQN